MSDEDFDNLLRWIERREPAYAEGLREHVAAAREEGRREGFEKAREMAADLVTQEMGDDAAEAVDAIRAMRDGADCSCLTGAMDLDCAQHGSPKP